MIQIFRMVLAISDWNKKLNGIVILFDFKTFPQCFLIYRHPSKLSSGSSTGTTVRLRAGTTRTNRSSKKKLNDTIIS